MGNNYGVMGWLALSIQSVFGTPTSSWSYLPIISEAIDSVPTQDPDTSLKGHFDPGPIFEGQRAVAGDIVFIPPPDLLGFILKSVVGDEATVDNGDTSYTHTFTPRTTDFAVNCALQPFTLQIHRGVATSERITDVIFTKLVFTISGGKVSCTASVVGRATEQISPTSPSFADYTPWYWKDFTVTLGGAGSTIWRDLTITIDNLIDSSYTLSGTAEPGALERSAGENQRSIAVSGNLNYDNITEYNKFQAGTSQALVISGTSGHQVATGPVYANITFDIKDFHYTSAKVNLGGPGRMIMPIEGIGKYSSGDSKAFDVSLLNNTATY